MQLAKDGNRKRYTYIEVKYEEIEMMRKRDSVEEMLTNTMREINIYIYLQEKV